MEPQEALSPKIIKVMESDAEIDAEINQMTEETLAGLEKPKDIWISMAEKVRESMFLTQIKLMRSNYDVLMSEWQVELIFSHYLLEIVF